MSSKGNLATGEYSQKTLEMAQRHKDFVMGFISMRRFPDLEGDFLILTPGVALDIKGDALGQQYRTPEQVITESGCDVIIVGRGIYAKFQESEEAVRAEAKRYQEAGWDAYLKRIA
jgi:orotidine-5'-phosphate decarboxylase